MATVQLPPPSANPSQSSKMILTRIPQSFKLHRTVDPVNFEDLNFPYDVRQFQEIINLSSRRSRAFIRSAFELGLDYKIIGNNHRMVLSKKCLDVAVVLAFKFLKFPALVNQDYIPPHFLYREDILAAIALKNSRRLAKRRGNKIPPGQLSFNLCYNTDTHSTEEIAARIE